MWARASVIVLHQVDQVDWIGSQRRSDEITWVRASSLCLDIFSTRDREQTIAFPLVETLILKAWPKAVSFARTTRTVILWFHADQSAQKLYH
jgi:hypothetical protein